MQQTGVVIQGKNLSLDGVVSHPEPMGSSTKFPGVVVCHPHPLFGGSMDNPLVVALCRGLNESGFATLRFNFRIVKGGEGTESQSKRAEEDLQAALKLLESLPGIDRKRLGLAGYSFGASVMIKGLKRYKRARALAFVSPLLPSLDGSPIFKEKKPKLFVTGERDRLVPVDKLMERLGPIPEPVEYQMIIGADHTWRGHEEAMVKRVVRFFNRSLMVESKK